MSRILTVLSVISILISYSLTAQDWQSLGDGVGRWPWSLYGDSISDALYVGGRMENLPALTSDHVMTWDQTVWTTLSSNPLDPGVVRDIVRFQENIYVGGSFTDLTGTKHLGYWDGGNWNALSKVPDESIFCLLSTDEYLYAGGLFHEVDSMQSPGIAAWNGTQWTAIPGLAVNPRVYALAYFNGYLIAGGNSIPDDNGQEADLKYYKDSTWQAIPGWQIGGWGDVLDMAVYQDHLYVGGNFSKMRGAFANYIARWDGNQWYELGSGPDFMVETLVVHRGELYAGGRFSYVDGVPAQYIAKWNGRQWCSLSTSNIDGWVTELAVWRDTLYAAGGFRTISGDTMNYVAKWMEGTSDSLCGPLYSTTAIEPTLNKPYVNVYPNPSSDHVFLELEPHRSVSFRIMTPTGICIQASEPDIRSSQLGLIELNVSTLLPGVYLIEILIGDRQEVVKFLRN